MGIGLKDGSSRKYSEIKNKNEESMTALKRILGKTRGFPPELATKQLSNYMFSN